MKNIIKYIAAVACMGALVPAGMTSCTDMGGDGVDSVIWNGSQNPDNTSFHNPVIEPSVEAGTVVKGASTFVAISSTTQWAKGLTNYCPTLSSTNLMNWTVANDAFEKTAIPSWNDSRVNSLSVDYARAITGATYWMFYTLEGANSIGVATATTAQGPYTDRGEFITAAAISSQKISDPFFFVVSTKYYLCYTTDDGCYLQPVKLNKNTGASLNGARIKLTDAQFSDIAIIRKDANTYYLAGTVNAGGVKEIHYAKSSEATGPFLDKNGNDLANGSAGELLVKAGNGFVNPENPMRGFVNSDASHLFIAFNATESGKDLMKSGFARRPLFVAPVEIDADGWLKAAVSAEKGWSTPRYE